MIASTQTTDTEVFAFTAVLVFKFLSRKFLFINRKKKCEIFRIFLKRVSDHLSLLFELA